jgi:hypothetical protein
MVEEMVRFYSLTWKDAQDILLNKKASCNHMYSIRPVLPPNLNYLTFIKGSNLQNSPVSPMLLSLLHFTDEETRGVEG